MSAQTTFWVIILLGFAALASFRMPGAGYRLTHPCQGLVMADCGDKSDFNFSTGVVNCGVSGLTTSCGSVKR